MHTHSPTNQKLIVYGHGDCGLALMLKEALDQYRIGHEWRDIKTDAARYQDELRKLARGNLSVPTVIFPDGTVMVEPFPLTVLKKLKRL